MLSQRVWEQNPDGERILVYLGYSEYVRDCKCCSISVQQNLKIEAEKFTFKFYVIIH